jgi:hypothetical protein
MFSDYHPPLPADESLYHQTKLSDVTQEELLKYRELARYTAFQRILYIAYFLVFGVLRLAVSLSFAAIAGGLFMMCAAIWRSFGRPEAWRSFLRQFWAQSARIFPFLLGFVKVTYHGTPDPAARFLVGNHICFFDGWWLLKFVVTPLGKQELLRIPCMREVADVCQAIAVDRSRSTGVTKLLIDSANDPTKPAIAMFPEGASTSGDYMLRFHLGAFLSDLPVQLISTRYRLWGTSRSLHHLSFFHHSPYHWLVFLGIPFITVEVTFIESMTIKNIEGQDPRRFADIAGLKIANGLGVRMLGSTSSALFKKKEE